MDKGLRLPAHIKPERYQIKIRPNLEEFTFSGQETIYLILEEPTKQITLHSVDLEIESAEWIHESKESWAGHVQLDMNVAGKISYDKKSETVNFTFPKILQPGKGQLKLVFTGILNDKMRGFYRSKYEHQGKIKHLATTQFESTDARRAFPCFDEPTHKAVFEVSLMIPGHTTAISNTIESNISEHESGYKLIEFAPTPKMSTYLLAFIVGEFESIEGRTSMSSPDLIGGSINNDKGVLVRVFTTPGKKKQAEFALDAAVNCINFYESYFGIKYPLPVLDLIAIPDFAAGAMENWGAVTYRESTLLIDEEKSSTANKQWVALVIAHELAHQWFGNLVTMEWWNDLWLNEGFACFIEYLAIDSIFPDWDIWTQFVGTEMASAFELDSLKNTHPIEVEVADPAEISEIFDKVSYAKGASILRMLWQYLGEEVFQKGLQYYLKKYSYGNASTKDLWESLEKISGKPVASIMKNWTKKPGHPVVNVKCKMYNPSTSLGTGLQLTQSRFFLSPISKKETKDNTIWSIPINNLLMDKKTMIIPNTGAKLNLGEISLVRIAYPKDYSYGVLSAPDRLGLIRDSFDLAQSGDVPTTQALELVLNYKEEEEDYVVWGELTAKLSKLDSLLAYEPFYENFQKYGREIYKKVAGKMGWEKKKAAEGEPRQGRGEKHTDSLLRGMVLYRLGHFGDQDTIKKAQELFISCHPEERSDEGSSMVVEDSSLIPIESGLIVQNDKSIDPDLRSVVYNLVAENGAEKEFQTLLEMYKTEDNQQEKDRIGRSLGSFQSKALLQKTLKFAISEHVRFQNSLQIISAVWSNPKGRYLAWEFVKSHWRLLKDRYAGGHYFTKVFAPAGEFTKLSDAKDIEKFVVQNPVPEAKRTIAQVLEQIYSNAAWLARDSKKIESFLRNSYEFSSSR